MDLTKEYPRSTRAELHGIAFLPLAIDKGRADLAGTVGEYFSRTGFSKMLTDFLEIDIDEFVDALAEFIGRHRGFLEPLGLAHLAEKISMCERIDLEEGRSIPGIEDR